MYVKTPQEHRHDRRTSSHLSRFPVFVVLESRLLPQWALEIPLFDANLNRSVTYHELCPRTPMLFFNHYWNGVPDSPLWPKEKPVYLMPNIEMFELNEEHYWRVDVVLCKTRDCEQRLRKWYVQEGNPRNAKVVYTRHSSSDLSTFAERRLGADAVQPKDYANVRFVHTVGTRYAPERARKLALPRALGQLG